MKAYTRLFVVTAVLLALGLSHSVRAASSGPATKKVSVVLSGTAAQAGSGVGTDGQCDGTPWTDQCSGLGNCTCIQVNNPSVKGTSKGGATASDFLITIDDGFNPATEPAVNGGPNPKCSLILGVVTITSTSNSESQTLNLIGTSCKQVIGISSKNPLGTQKTNLLTGGWGISNTPAPSPNDESGWGTMTGSESQSTSALTLKLSGLVSK